MPSRELFSDVENNSGVFSGTSMVNYFQELGIIRGGRPGQDLFSDVENNLGVSSGTRRGGTHFQTLNIIQGCPRGHPVRIIFRRRK